MPHSLHPVHRQADGSGPQSTKSNTSDHRRARRRHLIRRSSFFIAPMVPAVAIQGRHPFCVLAVHGAVLLARRGHTRTSHVCAFGRCRGHGLLLKLQARPENSPSQSGQPSGRPKWQNSTPAPQSLAWDFSTSHTHSLPHRSGSGYPNPRHQYALRSLD